MKEVKPPHKSFLYYYLIVMVVVMLLNALVFPLLMGPTVMQVDYGTFLKMVDDGEVDQVQVDESVIYFTTADSESKWAEYATGRMDDPDLVNRLYEAGVVFSQEIQQENSPLLNFILTWVLPLGLFFVVGQLLLNNMQKRMGGGAMQFGKSNHKVYVEAQTGKTFADVAGEDEAKEALEEIVTYLHDSSKYASIGAQLPKGVLLVGPPGTGKTLLAKAVAGEAGVPFFSISGSEFVEMFVGMGAARVRDLFKQAQEKAPCIVFIDEIDAIGTKRNAGGGIGGNDEREQTLNQLLTEMDGFDGGKGVVILAATNRPESLDPALLRPGRFDRRVPVELPDLKGREAILKVHAQKVKMDEKVDFLAIARATSGASGAELANIINESALRAVREGRQEVVQADLEESVEVVIAGYQRKNAVLSARDKRIVSYHEIGHALVAAMQKGASPVHKITIVPRTSGALGYTMQVDEQDQVLISKQAALQKITTLTGGRAAEALAFDSITTGASNDIEQATKLARAMITRYGMSDNFGMMALETGGGAYLGGDSTLLCSPETAAKVDDEVKSIIDSSYREAYKILSDNRDKLDTAAAYLLEHETITGEEFMRLIA